MSPLTNVEVVVGSPHWSLNGANVFSENLVRGLVGRGVAAHVLLTGSGEHDTKLLPRPVDLPLRELLVRGCRSWPERWSRLREYLVERAPCIWVPNHDYAYSALAPELPRNVGIVGVVHSDDPQHYAHAHELGRYWNATVAVSRAVRDHLASTEPLLAPRLHLLHHGVPTPPQRPQRQPIDGRPLRILYVGRLVEKQKRISDLVRIADALALRDVDAELTVVGGGPGRADLEDAAGSSRRPDSIRFGGILDTAGVFARLREHDVLVLVSDFEGLPLTVLEAMAQGCIPVVSAVRSGVPELVRSGRNGFAVGIGDVEGFATALATLAGDDALRERLSAGAFETVKGHYTLDAMTDRYLDLFGRVAKELADGSFARPPGRAKPLPWMRASPKDRIPAPVRRLLARAKRVLAS